MAMAWSRISSKVIAHPPFAEAAYRRRCGNGTGRSDACIPHRGNKRKQEVLGACDAEEMPFSQTRGGMCHVCLDIFPKHYWRFIDSEALELQALSWGSAGKLHEHEPNAENGKASRFCITPHTVVYCRAGDQALY